MIGRVLAYEKLQQTPKNLGYLTAYNTLSTYCGPYWGSTKANSTMTDLVVDGDDGDIVTVGDAAVLS